MCIRDRPYRGKANEPAHVSLVGAAVAEAMARSVDEVAETATANAQPFYRLQ